MVLGLERADRVARKLLPQQFFTPQRSVKVVTIGGTNGKGSTVATLAALLQAAGIRVGAWTSPHLLTFNERICIDGEMVPDHLICDAFARIEALRGDDFLSYFEFGALAAMAICVEQNVDVMLLEVGIGGRLDAVNIVDADISIVTTVDLDHQAWLGDTIEAIADVKAGIFRAGRPAICGEYQPAKALLNTIAEIGAQGLRRGLAFDLITEEGKNSGTDTRHGLTFTGTSQTNEKVVWSNLPQPPLPLTSVACALQALLWLYPETPRLKIEQGLAQAKLTGRCQRIETKTAEGREVAVLLDVAHNPQSARYLADYLSSEEGASQYIAVLGMLNDKDLDGVIAPFADKFASWHVATVDFPARARAGIDLEQALVVRGEPVYRHDSVVEALAAAFAWIDDCAEFNTTIVVFGSFHTVAEAITSLDTISVAGHRR